MKENEQKKIVINVQNDTIECHCPKCGSALFKQQVTVRRVPGLRIGQSKDAYQPFAVFVCANCRTVVDFEQTRGEFVPKSVKILRTLADIARIVLPFLRKR
jgi:transposase-like protein